MAGLTTIALKEAIARVTQKIEASQSELDGLDGQLGDGDIGVTMVNGMRSMSQDVDELPDDVGMALMKCAQALTRAGGSSYATLLATGLMRAAKEVKGQTEVPWSALGGLLQAALERMSERGKSQLGDKTVLDAVEAVRLAVRNLNDPSQMQLAAATAIENAMDAFRDQPCRQGRARIFGDRSVGLDDPGMLAFMRIVEGLGRESSP